MCNFHAHLYRRYVMLKQKSILEGRFQDIIKKIDLNGAFGYKIIANKLISLMKDDNFTLYLLNKYGEKLLSVQSQYNKSVKNLYDKYKRDGKLESEEIRYLKDIFPIYVKQIIISMTNEGDLFVLGNPSKGLIRNNIEDFAFTFDKNLETNEISKGEVIDVLRERLTTDLDDQCLAILLLLDNQTEEEIDRIKTILKNKVGFSNRTERLTAIGLKLRSDDPFLTDEDLKYISDIRIHARQLFENYKDYFSVVKTPNETYYFNNDSFVTED